MVFHVQKAISEKNKTFPFFEFLRIHQIPIPLHQERGKAREGGTGKKLFLIEKYFPEGRETMLMDWFFHSKLFSKKKKRQTIIVVFEGDDVQIDWDRLFRRSNKCAQYQFQEHRQWGPKIYQFRKD